jgi:flagellar hook-associated protein 3 FlgL
MELIGNRVTQRSISSKVLLGLNANQDRMADIQQRLATGKNITKPSDDPTGAISALQMRSDVRRNETWQRNGQDGLTWLGTTDSALTSALEVVRRVRDLTVQAASTGGNDAVSNEALATEIDKLKENLIGIANTKYIDRPVFGGTTAGGLAYDVTGNYIGDACG